jgi:hypothetical protein
LGGFPGKFGAMNHEDVLAKLHARARGLFPASCEIEDFVNDAFAAALESGTAPEKLFDAADAHLRKLRTQEHWQRHRMRQVPLEDAPQDSAPPTPRRRPQSRGLRRPKGVTASNTADFGPTLLKWSVQDIPSPEVQLAANCLATVDLMRVGFGEPCTVRAARLISALYAELYGVASPRNHWAAVLLEEIDEAKLQELRAREVGLHSPPPPGATATLTRKKPRPGEPKSITVPMDVELVPSVPGRAVQHYYAVIDGKRARIGAVAGSFDSEFRYPADPVECSHVILQRVRIRLSSLDVPQRLPAFADDPLLVRWLLLRTGFEGGGGQDAVKRSTLLTWLQKPDELVRQLVAYACRRAEFATDAGAERMETELTALAERVRTRAQPCTP